MYHIYVVQLMYPQIRGRVALPHRTTGGSEASTVLYSTCTIGLAARPRTDSHQISTRCARPCFTVTEAF